MRFAPTEEQLEFAAAVRSVLEDTCTTADVRAAWSGRVGAHTGVGSGDGRVRRAWDALAELGVLGLTVPAARGGLAMTDDDLVGILLECGRAGLPDPIVDTAGVAPAVLAAVDGEVAAGWQSRIAGGATVVIGFGADPLVASASTADAAILFEHDPVLLEDHAEPEARSGVPGGGIHLLDTAEIELDEVDSVDGSRALSRVRWTPGDAPLVPGSAAPARVTTMAFDRAAVHSAALLVGLSRRMLEMTVEYVGERRQFGVPIGSFQAVKHHLADAGLALEFAEPLVRKAAHLLSLERAGDAARDASGGPPLAVAVSMAKARASAAALRIAETALQCHGAIGYTVEADLHLFMKRAWALARVHGDEHWHLRRVRQHLLAE